MIRLFWIAIFAGLVFSSCAAAPVPVRRVEYGYPQLGNTNNAAIAVKDYTTLGTITVKSAEVIDGNGNRTGSKITYEMLMREAQRLNADDIINVRIDVNEKLDFDLGGNPIRTTHNYTATASAIRYTTAIPGVAAAGGAQRIENIGNIAVRKMKKIPPPPPPKKMYSDTSGKHWLSMGLTMAGTVLTYEGMINDYVSLGLSGHYQWFGNMWNAFGVDVFTRAYPFGKVLFLGAGLGFHGGADRPWGPGSSEWVYQPHPSGSGGNWTSRYHPYRQTSGFGFGITPEIGVKIDPGAKGRFFMEIGYKNPLVFGGEHGFYFNTVPFITIGGAF